MRFVARRNVTKAKFRCECQCGMAVWLTDPRDRSLAALVRQARREHACDDPDIMRVETEQEYERRVSRERAVLLGDGFC